MDTKRCFKCEETKPLVDFYRHPMMGDGRLGKCKACTKRDVSANYERRRDRYLAYERARYNRPEREASRKASAKRWAEDPRHRQCLRAVERAVKSGLMARPQACSACARTDRKLDAHHHDYDKPLEVAWLCRSCHRREHAAMRAAAAG